MKAFENWKEGLRQFLHAFGQLLCFIPSRSREVDRSALEEIRQRYASRNDGDALRGDWERVGSYIQTAMNQYDHEQAEPARTQSRPASHPDESPESCLAAHSDPLLTRRTASRAESSSTQCPEPRSRTQGSRTKPRSRSGG